MRQHPIDGHSGTSRPQPSKCGASEFTTGVVYPATKQWDVPLYPCGVFCLRRSSTVRRGRVGSLRRCK